MQATSRKKKRKSRIHWGQGFVSPTVLVELEQMAGNFTLPPPPPQCEEEIAESLPKL